MPRPAATPAVYIGTLFGSSGPVTPAADKPTLALPVDEVVQLAFF